MDTKIFQDENHSYQFDFSSALRASNQLNSIFQKNTSSLLSDVDFIAETEDEIIFVEFKNAKLPEAANPTSMVPTNEKLQKKLAFKYYDSWLYISVTNCYKPVTYVCVIEFYHDDSTMRRKLRNYVANLLPFRLQQLDSVTRNMIHEFDVLSINEWNNHERFKHFPITPIAT